MVGVVVEGLLEGDGQVDEFLLLVDQLGGFALNRGEGAE